MRTRENASMSEFLTDFVKWVPRMDPEGAQKLATNLRFASDGDPQRNTPKPTPHKRLGPIGGVVLNRCEKPMHSEKNRVHHKTSL